MVLEVVLEVLEVVLEVLDLVQDLLDLVQDLQYLQEHLQDPKKDLIRSLQGPYKACRTSLLNPKESPIEPKGGIG